LGVGDMLDFIGMEFCCLLVHFLSVFGSVIVIAFQIVFRAEIYVNDIFLFFKNYF